MVLQWREGSSNTLLHHTQKHSHTQPYWDGRGGLIAQKLTPVLSAHSLYTLEQQTRKTAVLSDNHMLTIFTMQKSALLMKCIVLQGCSQVRADGCCCFAAVRLQCNESCAWWCTKFRDIWSCAYNRQGVSSIRSAGSMEKGRMEVWPQKNSQSIPTSILACGHWSAVKDFNGQPGVSSSQSKGSCIYRKQQSRPSPWSGISSLVKRAIGVERIHRHILNMYSRRALSSNRYDLVTCKASDACANDAHIQLRLRSVLMNAWWI